MLYNEFLAGTGAKNTDFNYQVYKSLEALYMEKDNMTKADVYAAGKKLIDNSPTEAEKEAEAMRAFYRFSAAYLASFYTEQSRTATQAQKAEADQKSEKAYKRAVDLLSVYNMRISCPGLYPVIEHKNGMNFSHGYFYN